MSTTKVLLISVVLIAMGYGITKLNNAMKSLPIPELDMKRYWGPGDRSSVPDSTKIEKFVIDYSQEKVDKLKELLRDTSYFPKPLENVQFQYGMNTMHLKSIVDYWRDNYLENWVSKRQPHLNKYPQFKTQIQGLNIHYIHVVPNVPKTVKVYPILLLHGWPGSVVEFYDMIPLLASQADGKDYAFEVIVPSLPGYGFSDAASKQGLHYGEMAIIFHNLMQRLGKDRYFIQGGDWGAAISKTMAAFFPDNVIGLHSNMCFTQNPVGMMITFIGSLFPKLLVENEKYVDWYYPLSSKFSEILKESGYMHIQATKPDTIGLALSNNPIGLAAYILEKFSTWTNPNYRELSDGGLKKHFTMDQLLDNLMMYYMTNSILTSQRLYKESIASDTVDAYERIQIRVPCGCNKLRYELMNQMDCVLRTQYNLVHSTHLSTGGHFAAMQLPKLLYDDVIDFVDKVIK